MVVSYEVYNSCANCYHYFIRAAAKLTGAWTLVGLEAFM